MITLDNDALRPFKIIQGRRNWYQSTVHIYESSEQKEQQKSTQKRKKKQQ